MVWKTVHEAYFDPKFGGVDWMAVRTKYEAGLEAARDKPALRALLQQMLGEMRRSHFAILPREAAVFAPEERVKIGKVGAEVAWTDGGVVVTEVQPESSAAEAGLKSGEALHTINGRDLAALAGKLQANTGWSAEQAGGYVARWATHQLCGAVGSRVTIEVADANGVRRTVEVAPKLHEGPWSEPMGSFPSWPIELNHSLSEDGVGYVSFNTFAREAFRAVRDFVQKMPANGVLVIDLRGNPGGIAAMAAGLSGWLTDRPLWLGRMQMRQGVMQFTAHPQEDAFLGPVAVLIDGNSASTAEILAAGLQESGRARVFGEKSAGQALPSSFVQLPMGDLFQYAMADIITPRGVSLEGSGVTPDVVVRRTRTEVAAGHDAVLEAARAWLLAERQKATATRNSTPNHSK